jgi:hypothetical protein
MNHHQQCSACVLQRANGMSTVRTACWAAQLPPAESQTPPQPSFTERRGSALRFHQPSCQPSTAISAASTQLARRPQSCSTGHRRKETLIASVRTHPNVQVKSRKGIPAHFRHAGSFVGVKHTVLQQQLDRKKPPLHNTASNTLACTAAHDTQQADRTLQHKPLHSPVNTTLSHSPKNQGTATTLCAQRQAMSCACTCPQRSAPLQTTQSPQEHTRVFGIRRQGA